MSILFLPLSLSLFYLSSFSFLYLVDLLQLGAVNVFMTFVVVAIIDRIGRKPLLLYGFVGMAVCFALLTGFVLCFFLLF